MLHGMLLQVGHVQQVGQDVVAVEAHQRVDVEQHRGDGRHHQDIVHDALDESAAHVRPDDEGHGSDKELAEHARRTHERPVALFAERPARGGVHVRERYEQHEHDAYRMHLAAVLLYREGVPQFVENLDKHGADVHPADIGRRKQALGLVLERIEILYAELDRNRDGRKPYDKEELREKQRTHPLEPLEQRLRVENRNAQEEYVQKRRLDLLLGILLVALEKLCAILRTLVQEHVGLVKLGEHLDDLPLAGNVFGAAVQQVAPDFADRLVHAQTRDELVCVGRQAVVLVGERFKKDVPQNAAIHLPAHPDTGPESNPAPAEPVPGFMKYFTLLVENHCLCINLQKRKPQTGKPLRRANIHR